MIPPSPRHLRLPLAVLVLLLATQATQARPADQRTSSATELLREAARALDASEHQRAADLARGLLASDRLQAVDRAEAWRIYGLAAFFLAQHHQAEQAFLEYLKLEVDGRLDPALLPPEVIVFFEDVRARHAAELRQYRPPPVKRRYRALNLLPPVGQFQNGHHKKGWAIAGTGALLLATNIGSFWVLRRWCDPGTGVCESGNESRTEAARVVRTINQVSGILLLGVLAYGIYDGFHHYGAAPDPQTAAVHIHPVAGGGYLALSKRF